MITRQFGVSSVQELGCGSVDKLLSDASQASQSVPSPTIFFALPLLLNQSKKDHPGFREGVLGPQTPRDALKCFAFFQKMASLSMSAIFMHCLSTWVPQTRVCDHRN